MVDEIRAAARHMSDEQRAFALAWSFPKLNDKLLVVARHAQHCLALSHCWLWMLGEESKRERAHVELLAQERRPDWRPRAEAKEVGPLLKLIKAEIEPLN